VKSRLKIALVAVLAPAAGAQVLSMTPLFASDGEANDRLGEVVAVRGNVAAFGLPNDTVSGHVFRGSVKLFEYTVTGWEESTTIVAPDGAARDFFGTSVALLDDLLVVGAIGDDADAENTGAVYVFGRSGGLWSFQAKLSDPNGISSDYFGQALSTDGETIAVGAGRTANDPRVCVFIRSGQSWDLTQVLRSTPRLNNSLFGSSLAVKGNDLFVGAPFEGVARIDQAGAAYHFVRSNGTWIQEARYIAPEPEESAEFGNRVAVFEDLLVIAAKQERGGRIRGEGAVYVRRQSEAGWTHEARLVASDAAMDDRFGTSVAVQHRMIVVGAPDTDAGSPTSGTLYTFTDSTGSWVQRDRVLLPLPNISDRFGQSIAAFGTRVVAGSPGGDDQAIDQGAAWVVELEAPCEPPAIQFSSGHVQVLPGLSAEFAVSATGSGLAFQWQRNGADLQDSNRINGAQTQTLTITGVQNNDQGSYLCRVTNECGIAEAGPTPLSCAPVVGIQPPPSLRLEPGVVIAVSVPQTTGYTYRWRQSGQNLFNIPGFFSGATTRSLTIHAIDQSAAGNYDCVITNTCGQVVSSSTMVYCPSDANRDGAVDGDDVILFFQQWDANEIGADFTGDGAVDGDDVIGFFGRWDVGC
jgi:hypothetical protein